MGLVRLRSPQALLFFATFSQDPALLDRARELLIQDFGPLLSIGPRFVFDDTRYYERTMGPGLTKELFSVDRPIDQDELAAIKIATNCLEKSLALESSLSVTRAINIDPGMVDEGKVMLASTKNHAHRIYIGQGIFAEVTLYLREGNWEAWPWTYPDYKRSPVHAFLLQAREYFREHYKSAPLKGDL